jgi:metal-responsive CopG/Arc/MetJ family transcriptional regulator
LPTDTLAAVDAYAEKAGISRSDAVRQLIEASLKKVKGRG